jgi:hypothetical protein
MFSTFYTIPFKMGGGGRECEASGRPRQAEGNPVEVKCVIYMGQ